MTESTIELAIPDAIIESIRWGLPAARLEILRRIPLAEPAVQRAILFGSLAKGTHKPGTDIDLRWKGKA